MRAIFSLSGEKLEDVHWIRVSSGIRTLGKGVIIETSVASDISDCVVCR